MLLLRFGLVQLGDGEETLAGVDAFAQALSQSLGDPVRPLFAPNYKSLLTALEQNIAQIVWVPPLVAARAVRNGTVLAAAVAQRGGASSYATALFARADSGLAKPNDLEGARVAWVDSDSAGGYAVIRESLRASGVDLKRAFGEEVFVGSHEAVARAVAEGRADVGATYVTYRSGTRVVARAGWRDAFADRDFRILAEAGPIPSDFFGVHKTLAGTRFDLLQGALVNDEAGGAGELGRRLFQSDGFVRPTPEHLAALEGMLAGLSPSSVHAPVR